LKAFFDGIIYLLITVGIFALTYYSTKFISRKSFYVTKAKNLKVIERVPLGKEKEVVLLKSGGQFFLVGISQSSISFSTALETDEAYSISENSETAVSGTGKPLDFMKSYAMQALIQKISSAIQKATGKNRLD
jgi:flagellar biogenesis protein FliO